MRFNIFYMFKDFFFCEPPAEIFCPFFYWIICLFKFLGAPYMLGILVLCDINIYPVCHFFLLCFFSHEKVDFYFTHF